MKKLLLLTAALAVSACSETIYNAAPGVFPPVEGPHTLPSQASGYYQGTDDQFLLQLSDADQSIWNTLSAQQREIATPYLRSGGTLASALKDEAMLATPPAAPANGIVAALTGAPSNTTAVVSRSSQGITVYFPSARKATFDGSDIANCAASNGYPSKITLATQSSGNIFSSRKTVTLPTAGVNATTANRTEACIRALASGRGTA